MVLYVNITRGGVSVVSCCIVCVVVLCIVVLYVSLCVSCFKYHWSPTADGGVKILAVFGGLVMSC